MFQFAASKATARTGLFTALTVTVALTVGWQSSVRAARHNGEPKRGGVNPSVLATLIRVAPEVKVTTSDNTTTNGTDFTVEITGLDNNTKWRDLHIYAAAEKKFPNLNSPTSGTTVDSVPAGSSQSWKVKRNSGGNRIDIYTGTGQTDPVGLGNGTYTFRLDWKASEFTKAKNNPITWKSTKDGTETPATDGSDKIYNSDDGDEPAPKVRQLSCSLNGEEDLRAVIGSTTVFGGAASAGFSGYGYEIYSSIRLVSDYSDTLAIGIDNEGSPVPSSWGLEFSHMTGTLSAAGLTQPSPSIAVPNNASLLGNVLYLVLTIKENGQIILCSNPITVTLSN